MVFVTFDPENGDLNLQLPDAYSRFRDELYSSLAETFMGREIDEGILTTMNQYVENWIQKHQR